MTLLSLDAIEILNIVNSSGSFSSAAARLNKTPSAISYRVATLEHKLGVKLFERNGPKVQLTDDGKKIAKEGVWILKAVSALEQGLQLRSSSKEIFRIGVSETFPTNFFKDSICNFIGKYQEIKINIHKFGNQSEWDLLSDNFLDLIFTSNPCPQVSNAQCELISYSPVVCCATPKFIEEYKKSKSASNFSTGKYIVISNKNINYTTKQNFHCLKMNNRIITSDMEMLLSLLRAGSGFGVVPQISVQQEIDNGILEVVDLDAELGRESIWMAMNPYRKTGYHLWWQEQAKLLSKISCSRT